MKKELKKLCRARRRKHRNNCQAISKRNQKANFYGELANTAKTVSEPTTVVEAMSCSEKKKWKEAMEAEFQSLHDQTNQVWDLVTPPKDCSH